MIFSIHNLSETFRKIPTEVHQHLAETIQQLLKNDLKNAKNIGR